MNTETAKHTSLPWKAVPEPGFTEGVFDSANDTWNIEPLNLTDRTYQAGELKKEDAIFIVEACNSYYDSKEKNKALVEACKAAVRYDKSIAGKATRGEVDLLEHGGIAIGEDLDSLYNDWISKAKNAIAKAEEGK